MKARAAASILSGLILLALALPQAKAQQTAQDFPAAIAACGPAKLDFDVKPDKYVAPPPQVPSGKVLVYLFENVARLPFHGVTVRVGVDGKWVGATEGETYLTFLVDPGVHHVCVWAQASGWNPMEDGIALHRLNAQTGKTYYFRTRISQPQGSATTLLDAVDDDQAQLLLQTSALSPRDLTPEVESAIGGVDES
jgi:hypothetical protein